MRKPRNDFPAARFNFYRSKNNGVVYPAMTFPSGYEDKHPNEWEGVSDDVGRQELKLERLKGLAAHQSRAARTTNEANLDAAIAAASGPVTNIEPEIEWPEPERLGTPIIPPGPPVVEA